MRTTQEIARAEEPVPGEIREENGVLSLLIASTPNRLDFPYTNFFWLRVFDAELWTDHHWSVTCKG